MTTILTAVTAVLLIAAAVYSACSKKRFPPRGIRRSERLLVLAAVAVVASSVAMAGTFAITRPQKTALASAMTNAASQASCATIATGMEEAEVLRRLGEPSERRADEETRGPGATILLYRQARCAIYLHGGKVESVD